MSIIGNEINRRKQECIDDLNSEYALDDRDRRIVAVAFLMGFHARGEVSKVLTEQADKRMGAIHVE